MFTALIAHAGGLLSKHRQQSDVEERDEVPFAIALGENDVENPSVTAEEQVADRL